MAKKKKKHKRVTRNDLDKMSFEKRERLRKKLREEAVYTRHFRSEQTFGAASKCVSLSLEEYLSSNPSPEVLKVIKNEFK